MLFFPPASSFQPPAKRAALGTLLVSWLSASLGALPAEALEERHEDLSASVEIAGIFGIDVPNTLLTFAHLSPGEVRVLGEGHFYHEVTCQSNYGRPWYLKAQLVSLRHTSGQPVLPASQLAWRIVETNGEGDVVDGRSDFQAFAEQPVLVYRSGGGDHRGQKVVLRLQYRLTTPSSALAGTYTGQIIFTMTENP